MKEFFKQRTIFSLLIFGVVVLISSFGTGISLLTNWLFFQEVGLETIFTTQVLAQVILFVSAFTVSITFLLINIFIAIHRSKEELVEIPQALIGKTVQFTGKLIRNIGIGIAVLTSLGLAGRIQQQWDQFYLFFYQQPFNVSEPIFNQDIGFYMFSLPIFETLQTSFQGLIIFSLILTTTLYVFRGGQDLIESKSLRQAMIMVGRQARIHIAILLTLLLVSFALGSYLQRYELLFQQNVVYGVNYVADAISIPLIYVNIGLLLLIALFVLYSLFSIRYKLFVGSIIGLLVIQIAQGVIPQLVQTIYVEPNELRLETPYIEHSIDMTRQAYGLHEIEERTLSQYGDLTINDIQNNDLTLSNVRLWDRQQLLSALSQLQEIRTYYEFVSVENDRYMIDNELRQIMLSPRELSWNSLPNRTWINERLTFTHGYGGTASPVNQVTPEGLPVFYVKNIPPESEYEELAITRPEIYYGELSNEYVITNTNSQEFSYPKGEENVYQSYEGSGGVVLDSLWKRMLFAIRYGSIELLLSEDITEESRIIFNRRLLDRVQTALPFVKYDGDPYMIIADGKLFWIIDAYTTSSRFPYAQPIMFKNQVTNYVRNSVKIAVDAYNGDITLYNADQDDPIIQTYEKIFPNTFEPLDAMPASIRDNVRYPEDIFNAQTAIYQTYHMSDPQIFYNREDQWEIPVIADYTQSQTGEAGESGASIAPRHLVMKLPDEETEEYVLMLPFTPRGKDNLSAWMAARNDGENYGKILLYRFPKDSLVFGPQQVISRINQDADISQQISLWDQRGSQVIQGPLLVIPIEQSLIYIRPLYLQAEQGKIPELKRVIIAYENRIAMGETLEQGIRQIFGGPTDTDSVDETAQQEEQAIEQVISQSIPSEDIAEAQEAYENAVEAQQNGDWARYGEEIQRLGEILEEL